MVARGDGAGQNDDVTRTRQLWIGLAGLWPLAYVALLAADRSLRILTFGPSFGDLAAHAGAPLIEAKVALALTSLLIVGLVLACLAHLSRARDVPEEQQLPWALLLITSSVLAVPAYWYFQVWRSVEKPPPEPLSPRR